MQSKLRFVLIASLLACGFILTSMTLNSFAQEGPDKKTDDATVTELKAVMSKLAARLSALESRAPIPGAPVQSTPGTYGPNPYYYSVPGATSSPSPQTYTAPAHGAHVPPIPYTPGTGPRVHSEKITTWESFQIDGKRFFIVPSEDVIVRPASSYPTLPSTDGPTTYPTLQPVTEPAKP